MGINKEDAFMIMLITVITPFLIAYEAYMKIYNSLPHKVAERKKINEKIGELEKHLGIPVSENDNYSFDNYYYYNRSCCSREEYLHELERKVKENYTFPDIIVAAERAYASLCCPMTNENDEYKVLLLVDSKVYNIDGMNAKEYLEFRKKFLRVTYDFHWFFFTFQPCLDYSRFFVLELPIKVLLKNIKNSELINNYIEKLRNNPQDMNKYNLKI